MKLRWNRVIGAGIVATGLLFGAVKGVDTVIDTVVESHNVDSAKWVEVDVEYGDTLFNLIAEHNAHNDVDIRKLVDKAKYNDFNDGHWAYGEFNLQSHLTVWVPVVK